MVVIKFVIIILTTTVVNVKQISQTVRKSLTVVMEIPVRVMELAGIVSIHLPAPVRMAILETNVKLVLMTVLKSLVKMVAFVMMQSTATSVAVLVNSVEGTVKQDLRMVIRDMYCCNQIYIV